MSGLGEGGYGVDCVLCLCHLGNGEVGSEHHPMKIGFLDRYQSEYRTLVVCLLRVTCLM